MKSDLTIKFLAIKRHFLLLQQSNYHQQSSLTLLSTTTLKPTHLFPIQQLPTQSFKMQPFTILALVGTAFAATTPLSSLVPRQVLSSMTVKDAQALCGNDQTISCCNSVKQGDNINQSSGVLSGVLNGLLADGVEVNAECSKIDVAVRKYLLTPTSSIASITNTTNSHWCPGSPQRPVHQQRGLLPEHRVRGREYFSSHPPQHLSNITQSNGLVNAALPCVPIGNLVG